MIKKEGTEINQEIKRLPQHNAKSYDVKVPAFRYLYKLCASSMALLNPAGSSRLSILQFQEPDNLQQPVASTGVTNV